MVLRAASGLQGPVHELEQLGRRGIASHAEVVVEFAVACILGAEDFLGNIRVAHVIDIDDDEVGLLRCGHRVDK